MHIVHDHATAKLLEKVRSLGAAGNASWRCIHVRLSDKPERFNAGLRAYFVARALIAQLAECDGYVFLCDDGDIFVLFQGSVKAIVSKLSEHFEDVAKGISNQVTDESRFTIYDLSVDWQKLHFLCRDKLLEALAAPEGFYACFAYSPEMVNT